MTDVLDGFDDFVSRVRKRMDDGRRVYGDQSFAKPVDRLCDEVEQELLDVMGWGYVLCTRIQKQRAVLAGLVAEENRLLARIQYLERQKREAEGTRNHPGPNTIGGCELTAAE